MNRDLLKHFLSVLFFMGCFHAGSQPLHWDTKAKMPALFSVADSGRNKNTYTTLSQAVLSNSALEENDGAACKTTTFYMHLPAPAGQKLVLTEVQTLPNGDFALFGNYILANDKKEGFVMRMSSGGTILFQSKLQVAGKPVALSGAAVQLSGGVVVSGIVQDGTNTVTIARLKSDLSPDWSRAFSTVSPPLRVTIDLYNESQILFAVQLSSSVFCATMKTDGALIWSEEIMIDGLTNLLGFSDMNYHAALTVNCVRNNRLLTEVLDIDITGAIVLGTHTLDDNSKENKCLDVTAFSQRLNLIGVVKTGTRYELVRNIMASSSYVETKHTYDLGNRLDFNSSAAMDNAADALSVCLPQEGKLLFIKQFSYYGTAPEHVRQYSVPVGARIAAVSRSFDGGYLFGLDTKNATELVLIKTDSIGILAGCDYETIAVSSKEEIQTANTEVNVTVQSNSLTAVTASASFNATALEAKFDCQESYCPPPPVEDTCLSTYYKTYRSNSYVDAFGGHHLMRNNKQLIYTGRYDRILSHSNQLTYGLKLFDENGTFIKGVNIFTDGLSMPSSSTKMDDESIMLVTNASKNNERVLAFTLVSDDLQILWSKAIAPGLSDEFYSGGVGVADVHKDEEGNYYAIGTSLGFNENPKVLVYKMDGAGNQIWLKVYGLEKGVFGTAQVVTTKSSVVVVIEGSPGSVSVCLDKTTGAMRKSFYYQNGYAGAIYNRLLRLEGDRIFYAGNNSDEKFVMGLFDTTGRPLKFKYINHTSSILRAGTVRSGLFYGMYNYFDGSTSKDVFLKADTALNLIYANEYKPLRHGFPSGMDVGDNGAVYVAGNFSHGGVHGNYYDPYLMKYNSNGELGACGYTPLNLPVVAVDLKTETIGFTAVPRTFSPADVSVQFVPENNGQMVDAILCKSEPQCTSVNVSGPSAVCRINEDYTFSYTKNPLCNLAPLWLYDTAYVHLKKTTDSTVIVQFKKTGSTWLKARLNTGCVYSHDSVQVQIQKAPALFTLGKDMFLCPGDSMVLDAGSGFASYQWQDGATGSVFTVKKGGTYWVRVSNACGDVAADTLVIALAAVPSLTIGADITICSNETLKLTATAGFKSYTWRTQTSENTYQGRQVALTFSQRERLSVTAVTTEGCLAADSMQVNVLTVTPLFLGRDSSFCAGDSITLAAGAGYTVYNWSDGSRSHTTTVSKAGTYWVAATDKNGCTAKDTLIVPTLFLPPDVYLGEDKNLCSGDKLNLDAGNFVQYLWQDGSIKRTNAVAGVGTYHVQVTDANGCKGSDTLIVHKILPLPRSFLPPDTAICSYGSLELQPTAPFKSYLWSTAARSRTININQPAWYWLQVSDNNNCTGRDSVKVMPKECLSGLYVPNAFTPNKDGRNDVMQAKLFGNWVQFEFSIYNRWGEVVFKTTDPAKGWDGTWRSKTGDTNVFVWTCRYQFSGEPAKLEKGTLTLIR